MHTGSDQAGGASHEPAREALHSLSPAEATLFAILALRDPVRITRWTELVGLACLRESKSRAYSTATLRPLIERLEKLGLARLTDDGTYRCQSGLRNLSLRWAAGHQDFETLASACAERHGDEAYSTRVALLMNAPGALARLEDLHERNAYMAKWIALESTEPLDPAWYGALSEALRARVTELALLFLESTSTSIQGIYRHLASDVTRLGQASATVAAAFAGVAILRGDIEVARAVARAPAAADLAPALRVALLGVDGRFAEASAAAKLLPQPKRGEHAGVVFLLGTFALWLAYPASTEVQRRVAHGAKTSALLRSTFRVFDSILASQSESERVVRRGERDGADDHLTFLWKALHSRARSDVGLVGRRLIEALRDSTGPLAASGQTWLAAQYEHAAWALHVQASATLKSLVNPAPRRPAANAPPALITVRSSREPWMMKLDLLESSMDRLRPEAGGTQDAPSTDERILWRTLGSHGSLDPYIQKRTKGGKWTSGRKLAIKHLLGSSATLRALPPEDQRVARHAREDRQMSYGYPIVTHDLLPSAWLDLIGHPRVFVEMEDHPRRVVRGEPKIVVRADGDDVTLAIDPAGVGAGVSVRHVEDQLVVYSLDVSWKGILDQLARPLKVPAAGKERLGALIERLARVMPVESSESTRARSVMADARPRFRLVPSRGGLVITLLVRPLGETGALVTPGRGAPRLLGQSDGETVQTERDLAIEAERATEVVQACEVLSGRETGDFAWQLDEPEACLELVSTLRGLGEAVIVEWPHGKPLRVLARVGRSALRGKLRSNGGWFTLDSTLSVDGELSLELAQLLELLGTHPGRFVQLASGEYIELEQELRDVLDGIAAARIHGASPRGSIAISPSAVSVLDSLTRGAAQGGAQGGSLSLDATSSQWRARFDEVWGRTPRVPRTLQGELRDYQLEGFRWLARLADLGLGACLADDMGLGKTVQLVALLLHRAASGPALVVAPTSVCENWRRELERFAPSLAVRVAGPDRAALLEGLSKRVVVVTSYALLQQDADALQAITWSTVVLDEAQLIKNAETLRAKAAFGLRAEARVVATGTPVENHAGDLFSLFHFLNPGLLGPVKTFIGIMSAGGAPARARQRLLRPFVLRRTKAQVLEDLPPLTEIQRTVVMSPGEAKLYDSVRKAALAKLQSGAAGGAGKVRIQIFAELTRLRRLCCHPQLVAPEVRLPSSKLESFIELAEELVAGRHRVLVFSQFTDVLALVRPLLEAKAITYQYLDGSTPPKQRVAAVDAFQAGDGDAFLISLKAGGFGLNLTGADYVIHLDPWWNPAVEQQASDRAHRIGQTRPVTVYRLVTAGTIEERIVALHRDKRELADAVLADTDRAASLSAAELRGLLES